LVQHIALKIPRYWRSGKRYFGAGGEKVAGVADGAQLAADRLAEHAGVHENYISDLELGRKEICLRTLQAVAAAFGLKAADLLLGVE
jgi:transcriptional regulator with XRE-family HTH domain